MTFMKSKIVKVKKEKYILGKVKLDKIKYESNKGRGKPCEIVSGRIWRP